MAYRLQIRGDLAANWTSVNPVLAQREIGLETDTGKAKVGDGVSAWSVLPYWVTFDASAFATLTGAQALSNKILVSPEERWNVVAAAATGTVNLDKLTATVWYYTNNATANFTLNLRGDATTMLASLLAVTDAVSFVFLNTNGPTPYYPTAFTIDGVAATVKWAGTAPSAGNANAVDAYILTICKTSATPTYLVIASAVKYA